MRISITAGSFAAVLLLAGCDLFIHTGGTRDEPYVLTSLDAPCYDALTGRQLTAADLLTTIQSEYDALLRPLQEDDSVEAEPVALTIRTAYEDGALICHPAFRPPPGSAAPEIPAFVEVELTLEFVTEDGQFQETFPASFRGNTFTESLRPEEIEGTFEGGLEGWDEVRVGLSGTLQGAVTWGQVFLTGRSGGNVSVFDPVAAWENG